MNISKYYLQLYISKLIDCRTGQELILAIENNSSILLSQAVQKARKECAKPSTSESSDDNYAQMNIILKDYLTRDYPCGEDKISMTPLQYSKSLNSSNCEVDIQNLIDSISKTLDNDQTGFSAKFNLQYWQRNKTTPPSENMENIETGKKVAINEKVNHERALEAKAKLIAFRNEGKSASK